MESLLQHAWNGLSAGAIYALIALGYTMVYGVLKLINFSHSEVFMVGSFAAYYAARKWTGLGEGHLTGLLVVLPLAMIACALLGFLIERGAYKPLRDAPRLNCLITAMGVSLLLQNLGQNIFGPDPKAFPTLVPKQIWHLGEITISSTSALVLGIAILLMMLLHALVHHTKLGLAMRAVSENPAACGLMGISTNAIITATFLIGASLAGAAGVLYGVSYPQIDPIMGVMPGLKAFVAAVLGGIGSIRGAMVGGLVIGLSEAAVVGAGFSTFRDAIAFIILIVILLVYPTGLFGRFEPEKV